MNQVSDARLAIAIHEAGAFPSLAVANYIEGSRFNKAEYETALRQFKDATGSDGLLLSVGSSALTYDFVVEPFLEHGFRHFEIFHWDNSRQIWPRILERAAELEQSHGAKILFKVGTDADCADVPYSTVILKGPEGAGRSKEEAVPLSVAFEAFRNRLPNTKVIVSGGISRAEQVRDYVSKGALGVAIGTLFAASAESPIDTAVKQKIVAAHAEDLKTHGTHRLKGMYASVVPGDSGNLTRSLASGIRSPGAGAVFLGDGVDQITSILPVRDIVDRLIACL